MILIDGSYLLHRAMHSPGCLQLKASDGTITGPIHYFYKTLKKLHRITGGDQGFVVAWDLGSSKYRKALFPEYKAGRSTTDYPDPNRTDEQDDFLQTYRWARAELHKVFLPLTEVISIQVLEVEADDIIAWFVAHYKDNITVVSRDQDFLQLVDDRVRVYNPNDDKFITKDEVCESWKLIPTKHREHLLLIRALMGDSSDGIPGLYGFGFATALKLSSTLLLEGESALDSGYKYVRTYLENKHIVERNQRLMDLRLVPDELRDDILQSVRTSLLFGSQAQSDELHERLWSYELKEIRGYVDSLISSNLKANVKTQVAEVLGVRL